MQDRSRMRRVQHHRDFSSLTAKNAIASRVDAYLGLGSCTLIVMRLLLISAVAAISAVPSFAAPKKVVQPKEMPAGRPFSPGILANNTLYIAGQTGSDLKTGKYPESFEDEVKQTF